MAFFADPSDAGRQLLRELRSLFLRRPVVVAIPKSGAPIARLVAEELGADLDVVPIARVCLPGSEVPIGAIDTDGHACITARHCDGVRPTLLDHARRAATEQLEAMRRLTAPNQDWTDRTVILVDDGAVTGSAMSLAIRYARRRGARDIVVGLPVAPAEVAERLGRESGCAVVLNRPARLERVAAAYERRDRVSEGDLTDLLRRRTVRDEPPEQGIRDAPRRRLSSG